MPGMEPKRGGVSDSGGEFKPAVPDLQVAGDQPEASEIPELIPTIVKETGKPDKTVTPGGGYGEITPRPEEPKPVTETVSAPPTPPSDPDVTTPETPSNLSNEAPHGISGFFKKLFGGGKTNQEKIIDTSYHTGEHKIDPERLAKLRQVGGDKGVIPSQDRYLNNVHAPENKEIDKAA